MRNPAYRLFWLIFLCILPLPGRGGTDVLLLMDATSPLHSRFLSAFSRELAATGLAVASTDQPLAEWQPTEARMYLSVGSRATETALQKLDADATLLSVLIPRSRYLDNISGKPLVDGKHGAIYLEQPLERQVQLAELIKPDFVHGGAILGPVSGTHADRFKDVLREHGHQPLIAILDFQDNAVRSIDPVISQSDIFFALPDSAVFNRAIAKWVLLSSLKHRVPVIAYSSSYVKAGAAAALFSTPEQIARQAARLVSSHLLDASPQTLPREYPSHFEVQFNDTVLKRLGIGPFDSEDVREQLSSRPPRAATAP